MKLSHFYNIVTDTFSMDKLYFEVCNDRYIAEVPRKALPPFIEISILNHGCMYYGPGVYKMLHNEDGYISHKLMDAHAITRRCKNFVLDKFDTGLYKNNGKIYLFIPRCESHPIINPYDKILMFNMKINLVKIPARCFEDFDKYPIKNEHSFIESLNQCVCMETLTLTKLCQLDCGHAFHFECLLNMVSYKPGSEVSKRSNTCPICTLPIKEEMLTLLSVNTDKVVIRDISIYNLDKYRHYICYQCEKVYCLIDRVACADHEPEPHENICQTCVPYKRSFNCPNCGMELEHLMGCRMFACCLYGHDKCVSNPKCNHGSTSNIKFCGHKWVLNVSNVERRSDYEFDFDDSTCELTPPSTPRYSRYHDGFSSGSLSLSNDSSDSSDES